jgi:hypothetical protein
VDALQGLLCNVIHMQPDQPIGARRFTQQTLTSMILFVGLAILAGCSTIQARKQHRLAAYEALAPSVQALVDEGKVELGMDTNAVYIAWGPPSVVAETPGPPPQTVWVYRGNRPVQVPAWTFLPTDRGYWSLEYTPAHYAAAFTKAEVIFQNGRVVSVQQF